MQRLRILLSIALFTSAWTTTKAATFDGFVYQDLGSYVKTTGYSPSTSLNVTVPATINGDPVTIIGDYAFQGKSTITQILLPDSIIEIGQHAFAFTAIESITIPDTVTTVGRAICLACGTLTEILVEPTSTSFTSIDGVLFSFDQTVLVEFPGGYLSDTYTIPQSVTLIDEIAIEPGLALKNIHVESGNNSYSSIDGVLFNKAQTTLIMYPANREHSSYQIPDSVNIIDQFAFNYVENLERVLIPASVSALEYQAFLGCDNLEELYFLGDAPTATASSIFLFVPGDAYYFSDSTGYTSPTWAGLTTIDMGVRTEAKEWLIQNDLVYNIDLATTLNESGKPLLLSYALDLPQNLNGMPEAVQAESTLLYTFFADRSDVNYSPLTKTSLEDDWTSNGVTLSAKDSQGYRTASINTSESSGFLKLDLSLIE